MGWSIRIGRIFGIDIKVHLTFLLIVVWGAFSYGGSAGPWYGVIVTLALFALVLLHELGHSLAAMGFGIPVKDITLLPIGGVARLERMPEKPAQELVVAVAGPLVNVILALLLAPLVVGLMIGQSTSFSLGLMTQPGLLGLLSFLLAANVSLVVFNMIPAFPLDGGRVFRAILGFFTDYFRATQIAVTVGRIFAFGLGLFAILTTQFWLAMIALFIFIAGGQEGLAVAARSKLRQVQVGQILGRNPVVLPPSATVGQIASVVTNSYQSNFPVLDPVNDQLIGVTTSRKVAEALAQGQWQRRVVDIMQQVENVPVVGCDTRLDEVQQQLVQTSNRVAAVYDGLNFQGLIGLEDIQRVFQFMPRAGSLPQRAA